MNKNPIAYPLQYKKRGNKYMPIMFDMYRLESVKKSRNFDYCLTAKHPGIFTLVSLKGKPLNAFKMNIYCPDHDNTLLEAVTKDTLLCNWCDTRLTPQNYKNYLEDTI